MPSGETVDVDQMRGRCEPELHHGDQALSPREDLGVFAVGGEEAERFIEGRRPVVLEARRQHRWFSLLGMGSPQRGRWCVYRMTGHERQPVAWCTKGIANRFASTEG